MVDEHLPEVLPPDIKELCDGQGPVEGQLQHVVPPDPLVHLVVWVIIPTIPNVPEPGPVPQACSAKHQDEGIEDPSNKE